MAGMISSSARRTHLKENLGDKEVKHGKILSLILVASYFFYVLAPPDLFPIGLKWYMVLGLGLVIYIVEGKSISLKRTVLYWSFCGLYLVGSVLALFRSTDIDSSLYLIVGSFINFLSYFLLIPSLSLQSVRKWILLALGLAALAWTFHVRDQMGSLSYLNSPYYLTGPGNDKNFIAFVLSLAITAVFCVLMLWMPKEKKHKRRMIVIKIGLLAFGLYLLYYVLVAYSRSGLIATCAGLLSIAGLYLVKRGARIQELLVLMMLVFLAYRSVSFVLQFAPQWAGYFSEDRLGMRVYDLQKTAVIIKDNPFIGIGIDQTKNSYSSGFGQFDSFERGLPHNLYLKAWAEVGLVGLIGYILWLRFFVRKLRYSFWGLPLVDQIWLMVYIPFFTMLFFLDIVTTALILLAFMTGMFYSASEQ